MKKTFTLILSMTLLFTSYGVLAQSTLPKEVQADLKQEEIISALKQKDFNRANDLFSAYDEIGVEMPPALIFMRAQVSFQLKNYLSAKQQLEQYLAKSERGSEKYKKALKMYTAVEPFSSKEEKRLKKEAEDATKAEGKKRQEKKNKEMEKVAELKRILIAGRWEILNGKNRGWIIEFYEDGTSEWFDSKGNKSNYVWSEYYGEEHWDIVAPDTIRSIWPKPNEFSDFTIIELNEERYESGSLDYNGNIDDETTHFKTRNIAP